MKRIISIVLVCTAFFSAFFFPSSISVNAASTKAKAMKAYKEFMETRDGKELFTIAYIDNNSVPELVLDRKPTGTRMSGFGSLYTYKNGEIVLVTNHLCTFGNWNINYTGGKFKYYKKTGIYVNDDTCQGITQTGYHKFKKTSETLKAMKQVYSDWTGITPATQYKINGEITTKSKFKAYVKKLKKGKNLTKVKVYKNTKKNRNKILK